MDDEHEPVNLNVASGSTSRYKKLRLKGLKKFSKHYNDCRLLVKWIKNNEHVPEQELL